MADVVAAAAACENAVFVVEGVEEVLLLKEGVVEGVQLSLSVDVTVAGAVVVVSASVG